MLTVLFAWTKLMFGFYAIDYTINYAASIFLSARRPVPYFEIALATNSAASPSASALMITAFVSYSLFSTTNFALSAIC